MTEVNETSDWLRTDLWTDTASSLEHLNFSLQRIPGRLHEWKWAIIAAHSALQGALVCVLSGMANMGALSDRSRKAFLRWIEESRANSSLQPPEEWVAELPVLLKRARDPGWMNEFGGMPARLNADACRDLKLLHELRNEFTHFSSAGWSIELAGLPRIVNAAVSLTQLLILTHPASTKRLEPEGLSNFAELFRQVSNEMKRLGADGLPEEIPLPEHLEKRTL